MPLRVDGVGAVPCRVTRVAAAEARERKSSSGTTLSIRTRPRVRPSIPRRPEVSRAPCGAASSCCLAATLCLHDQCGGTATQSWARSRGRGTYTLPQCSHCTVASTGTVLMATACQRLYADADRRRRRQEEDARLALSAQPCPPASTAILDQGTPRPRESGDSRT